MPSTRSSTSSPASEQAPPPYSYDGYPVIELAWGPYHNHDLRWLQRPGSALSTLSLVNASVSLSDLDSEDLYRAPVGALAIKVDGSHWGHAMPATETVDVHGWGPARLEGMVSWLLDPRCAVDIGHVRRLEIACGAYPASRADAPQGAKSIRRLLAKVSDTLTHLELTSPWLGRDGALPVNPLTMTRSLTNLRLNFLRSGDDACAPFVLERMICKIRRRNSLEYLEVQLRVPKYDEDPHVAARWMAVDKTLASKIRAGLLPRFKKLRLWVHGVDGEQHILGTAMYHLHAKGRLQLMTPVGKGSGELVMQMHVDADGFIYATEASPVHSIAL
ncbi:hypothetical protein HDZ31DRAFT_68744 [Schizophyllum fasciatum]